MPLPTRNAKRYSLLFILLFLILPPELLTGQTGWMMLGSSRPSARYTRISGTSPISGEADVSLERESIIRFSRPLPADADLAAAITARFGEKILPIRFELSPDGREVKLFWVRQLPASSRVLVEMDGSLLADTNGELVDGDRDDEQGGPYGFFFDTVSLSSFPGTKVSGRVMASELQQGVRGPTNDPLAGVRIFVQGAEDTLFTTTDSQGNFTLDNAPAGSFFVYIDGRTVTQTPGGQPTSFPNGPYYPFVGKKWSAEPGQEVTIETIYLPLVAAGTLKAVNAGAPTEVTFPASVLAQNPLLEGVHLTVPANSLYSDIGTRGGKVGIAPVPPERIPEPLPDGLVLPLVITVQTDGPSNFTQPVPVCFPNIDNPETPEDEKLPPGTKTGLWSFDHDLGNWTVVGSATISEDGTLACSDPGFGLLEPGWHGVGPGANGLNGELTIEEFQDIEFDDNDFTGAGDFDFLDEAGNNPFSYVPDQPKSSFCTNRNIKGAADICIEQDSRCSVGIVVEQPSLGDLTYSFPGLTASDPGFVGPWVEPGRSIRLRVLASGEDPVFSWFTNDSALSFIDEVDSTGALVDVTFGFPLSTKPIPIDIAVQAVTTVARPSGGTDRITCSQVMTFYLLPGPGTHWLEEATFPNGLEGLEEPFRGAVRKFKVALDAAGISQRISSTRRSNKRAYIFKFSDRIGREKSGAKTIEQIKAIPRYDPQFRVPQDPYTGPMPMSWLIYDGPNPDLAGSRLANMAFVSGARIAKSGAAWPSTKHANGLAVDWVLSWNTPRQVKNNCDVLVDVGVNPGHTGGTSPGASAPSDGNTTMHAIGATYGVKKLIIASPNEDPPHWEWQGEPPACPTPTPTATPTGTATPTPAPTRSRASILEIEPIGQKSAARLHLEHCRDHLMCSVDASPSATRETRTTLAQRLGSRKFFAIQDYRTGRILRRGRTEPGGLAHPSLVLPANRRIRHLYASFDGEFATATEYTTPGDGLSFNIPRTILYPATTDDSDEDGLTDVVEKIVGTSSSNPDTDGDGVNDGAELANRTNPLDNVADIIGVIASIDTAGNAADITGDDSIIAVADGAEGIALFNVFSRLNPLLVSQIETAGNVQMVALSNGIVLAAEGSSGAGAWDISNPTTPVRLWENSYGADALCVEAAAGFGFVGLATGAVVAVDLRTGAQLGAGFVSGGVQDLEFGGDTLYALAVSSQMRVYPINILQPNNFLRVRTPVVSSGDRGAGNLRPRLFASTSLLYVTHSRGYNTFSLALPNTPALIANGLTAQFGWKQLVLNHRDIAVAAVGDASTPDGPHNVRLYDTSNPSNTNAFLTEAVTPGYAGAVHALNALNYVADGQFGMQVVNFEEADRGTVAPTITLTTNQALGEAQEGSLFVLTADAADDSMVRSVEFIRDGAVVARDGSYPYQYRFVVPAGASPPTITLSARATDTGGNSTTTPDLTLNITEDATAPAVAALSPSPFSTATGVSQVAVTFVEPIDPASLAGLFTLQRAGADSTLGTGDDQFVTTTSSWDEASLTARFHPTGPLQRGGCRAVLAAGVKDLAGNATSTPVQWDFTVLGAQALQFSPANFSTAPALTVTELSATFNADIHPQSIGVSSLTLQPTVTPTGFDWNEDTRTAKWTVPALNAGSYVATLASTIADTTGVFIEPASWQFTILGVQVASLSPAIGSTSPEFTISQLRAVFASDVDGATVTPSALRLNGQPINGTASYNAATRTATWSLAQPLDSGVYTAVFQPSLVNSLGVSVQLGQSWTFTVSSIDPISTAPASNERTLSGELIQVSATYPRAINPATVTGSSFFVRVSCTTVFGCEETVVPGTASYDAPNNRLVYTPDSPLPVGRYAGVITSSVADTNGKAVNPYTWLFHVDASSAVTTDPIRSGVVLTTENRTRVTASWNVDLDPATITGAVGIKSIPVALNNFTQTPVSGVVATWEPITGTPGVKGLLVGTLAAPLPVGYYTITFGNVGSNDTDGPVRDIFGNRITSSTYEFYVGDDGSFSWNNPSPSFFYETTTNWTPNGLPTAGDHVLMTIAGTPGALATNRHLFAEDYTIGGPGSAAVLTLAAAQLHMGGGDLLVQAGGRLQLDSSVLSGFGSQNVPSQVLGRGTLVNQGTFEMIGGVVHLPFENEATVTATSTRFTRREFRGASVNKPTGTVTLGTNILVVDTLENQGAFNISPGLDRSTAVVLEAATTTTPGGKFLNASTGVVTVTGAASAGLLEVFSGSGAAFVNEGEFVTSGTPLMRIVSNFEHTGTLKVLAGNLDVTQQSSVSINGALEIAAGSRLFISGSIPLQSNTLVTGAGELFIPDSTLDGTLSPGTAAAPTEILTGRGKMTFKPSGRLLIDVQTNDAGGVDRLNWEVGGGTPGLALDGTLELRVDPGFDAPIGTEFILINVTGPATRTGQFATVTGNTFGSKRLDVVYDGLQVKLLVAAQ